MAYKPLTNKGKEFIRTRCTSAGDRLSGKQNYALGRSNVPAGTVFTSNAYNDGDPKTTVDDREKITTNEQLAENLITWFNYYAEEYLLDANIMAAQCYVESNYNLWAFSYGGKRGSSAMGITQFIDVSIYDIIFKNSYSFEPEIVLLGHNLTGDTSDIRTIVPYYNNQAASIISTPTTNARAIANRKQLFQNIVDNPKAMIKAQCHLMHKIGERNNNLAASSLFAYNRAASLRSKTYNEAIDKAVKKKIRIEEGTSYVDKIFKLLNGTYGTRTESSFGNGIYQGEGFGYGFPNEIDAVANRNLSNTLLVSGNFGLNTVQEKFIQSLHPVAQDKFRLFLSTIEKQTPFTVSLQSAYRSYAHQQRLKKEYAVTKPSVPVSSPGNSYHNFGLALDIVLVNGYVTYGHGQTKKEWIATGVPKIASDLGLVWGGDFSNYDPVHFDLSNTYALNSLKSAATAQFGTDPNKVNGNQIANLQPSEGGYS